MSANNSAIGQSWEDVEAEFMSFLTPDERAKIDANVKALGGLLDALEAGSITQAEFDAAFDKLDRPTEARRPVRPAARRRSAYKARLTADE